MSVLLTFLLQLLGQFLESLIQKWFNPTPAPTPVTPPATQTAIPTAAYVAANKAKFIQKVQWRFWYGRNRIQNASIMYDKMLGRYQETPKRVVQYPNGMPEADIKDFVAEVTDGLDKAIAIEHILKPKPASKVRTVTVWVVVAAVVLLVGYDIVAYSLCGVDCTISTVLSSTEGKTAKAICLAFGMLIGHLFL